MNDMTPPKGHNKPPAYDEEKRAALEAEARDFADAAGEWADLKEIDTEERAEKANDFLAQGRNLHRRIEDVRTAEKKPHLDAGKEVDAAFSLLKDIVESAAKKVKPLMEAFLKEQQRKADEARRAAEKAAREEAEAAEAARRAAEQRNDAVGEVEAQRRAEEAEKAAKAAEAPARAKVGSATGMGKTASLRTVRRAVIDNDLMALRHYRHHPEVIALLERLATAEIRSKDGPNEIPGFNVIEEKVL